MDVNERKETHVNVNDIHSVSDVNGESHGKSFRNKAFELDEVLPNSPISHNYTIDDGHKKEWYLRVSQTEIIIETKLWLRFIIVT